MKKNSKGFFLAETIVVIALVTTVMAFVYPNISKLNENFNNRTKYYDQTEDLLALKAFYKINTDEINDMTKGKSEDCTKIGEYDFKDNDNDYILQEIEIKRPKGMNLEKVYITNYMATPNHENYNFNKYLKRLKRTTNDTSSYRIIGVFKDGNITRFASLKIDNPNPDRYCNLGGN